MAGKFVISKASNGKFHFVLKASNGETIMSSPMYGSLAEARAGIESARASAADDSRFQRLSSKRDEPYFTLTASDGQILGLSEMYSSARARDNGIASVRRHAPEAKLEEPGATA